MLAASKERRDILSSDNTPIFEPPGHFYSPVADTTEVRAYLRSPYYVRQEARAREKVDLERHVRTWDEWKRKFVDFPIRKTDDFRYFAENNQFCLLDAWLLSAFISTHLPQRIIEIGSGYSTAVILDTIDRLPGYRPSTFMTIDPDLDRLRTITKTSDNLNALGQRVQDVDPNIFHSLESGDLLFIDSSHVLKTGSDVHYEYLHVLPSLGSGVFVHIHDIHFPLEYPRQWTIRENRSWNEAYLVDMILTYGTMFEIEFFADAFIQLNRERSMLIDEEVKRFDELPMKPFMKRVGSLYLRKC